MWQKLKHEWKTFVWALIGILVESWDTILSAQLGLVDPMVAPDHQWIVHMAIPTGMLALRRWRDAHRAPADQTQV